jgi:parallel beta-helix repeat protein
MLREVQSANASGTIYIRADGSIDPPTAPISTVDNVTYTFIDNLNESVVAERDNIVVDGAGHTVRGAGSGIGIDLSAKSNVTIKNMEIREFSLGIELNQSSNNTVSENNVTNNHLGIHLWSSSNNILSRNNITNKLAGIYLGFSPNNMIFQNRFVGCGLSVDSFSSLVVDNTVNGKPLVYLDTVSDYVVSCAGQVILMNCENIRVEGTDLCNASVGIELCNTNNTYITSNNITNNAIVGISLAFSSNNSISGNRLTNNTVGIDLWDSSNDTLSSNVISGNKYSLNVLGSKLEDFLHSVDASNLVDGKPVYYWVNKHGAEISSDVGYVAIVNCTEIAVRNLTLTNNGEGLLLAYTRNSYITNNTIANNSYGIYLFCSSNNNILGNRITGSVCGIRVYSSSDNSVYHNNFIDNTAQVDTYNSVNVWDGGYPSGGNYWSDYNGTDLFSGHDQNETGSDGIGDTEYTIDANNTDNYPLMGMFSDFHATSEYHVQTISNSSISDFQFNGTAISFDVTGDDGTSGFCRICIPTALMNVTYKVFVNGTEVSHSLLLCSSETYSYLYLNYTHSTQEVMIIPEFPSFLVLPLFMIASLLAVIAYKRKHTAMPNRG